MVSFATLDLVSLHPPIIQITAYSTVPMSSRWATGPECNAFSVFDATRKESLLGGSSVAVIFRKAVHAVERMRRRGGYAEDASEKRDAESK
jgi:hypothetical protein